TMQILTPTNTYSRAIASRPRFGGDSYAFSLESAKNAVSKKLSICGRLGFEEKVLVQRIAEAILQGELVKAQRALAGLHNVRNSWQYIESAMVFCLAGNGIEFLPLQRVHWHFQSSDEVVEIAVISILLVNEQRVLVLSSNERFGAHVVIKDGDEVSYTKEDADALLRQTGRRLAIELGGCPSSYLPN
ncbi:MAG TPA: hypothetical protein V6D22_09435, partial [Candidatus Obscuribacterales bacterium]